MAEYTISQHAKTRYAERILGRQNKLDVNAYIVQNEEKIKNDIIKMITYGELIFCGKTDGGKKDDNSNKDIYLKDTWTIIVDSKTSNVITLYKIDLGVDEEFNKEYVNKMLEKLVSAKEKEREELKKKNEDATNYRNLINENDLKIREYRSYIKNLEAQNEGYKAIVDNLGVELDIASAEVKEIVNTLIGKKTF